MISVVIPAFNEEGAILDVVRAFQEVLHKEAIKEFEIVVVDDGSTDATAERARSAGAMVKQHLMNKGYGASLKTGILAAKYKTIVICDADKTYPVGLIPELLREKQKGYDLVVGARQGEAYSQSTVKQLLRCLLKFLVEYTAGRKVLDVNSGMRVFDRDTVILYFNSLCNTFSFTTSQTLSYLMTGRYIKYVNIGYGKREGASKVKLFRDSLRTLQFIVQAALYYNPMKIFILLSGFCVAASVVLFVVTVFFHLLSAFILGIGCLLVSIIIFSLGLLAELLKKILDHNNVKSI